MGKFRENFSKRRLFRADVVLHSACGECIADYQLCIRDRKSRPVRSRDGSRRRGATRIKSSQVSVTVSAGLAARSPDLPDAEAVLKAADKSLYRAKRAGRNRVVY